MNALLTLLGVWALGLAIAFMVSVVATWLLGLEDGHSANLGRINARATYRKWLTRAHAHTEAPHSTDVDAATTDLDSSVLHFDTTQEPLVGSVHEEQETPLKMAVVEWPTTAHGNGEVEDRKSRERRWITQMAISSNELHAVMVVFADGTEESRAREINLVKVALGPNWQWCTGRIVDGTALVGTRRHYISETKQTLHGLDVAGWRISRAPPEIVEWPPSAKLASPLPLTYADIMWASNVRVLQEREETGSKRLPAIAICKGEDTWLAYKGKSLITQNTMAPNMTCFELQTYASLSTE